MEAPPAVVVDAHDVCPDLDRAQGALREALGGSIAPQAGWRLRVFDERRGTHVIVTANLDDERGNAVAHRVIDATASDGCNGVISALGIWAALVLDAEVTKAKAHPTPSTSTGAGTNANGGTNANANGGTSSPTITEPLLQPSGEVNGDAGAPQPRHRTLEIGASATLENSPLTTTAPTQTDAAMVGGDLFMLIEVVRSLFLRPTLRVATSVGSPTTYFASRVDACLRVPGNYVEHRGLLLETCAGTELGAIDHGVGAAHATDAMFSLGPTIGLRGDLASDLAVEVRGLADFNIIHTGDQIGLLSLRAELGLTWRLR